jgi:adenylate cyclase
MQSEAISAPIKILCVEDETDLELLLTQKFKRLLKARTWQLFFARNGLAALTLLAAHPDLAVVLTDIRMPEMDGLTLLEHLREQAPLVCTIVMTAYDDPETIRAVANHGAFALLTKPLDLNVLEATLHNAMHHHTRIVQQVMADNKASRLCRPVKPNIAR